MIRESSPPFDTVAPVSDIEQVWATDGPDWSEPTEVMAYSDWLEDQGRDAEACGARLLPGRFRPFRTDKRTLSWFIGSPHSLDGLKGADGCVLPEGLITTPTPPWVSWNDSLDRNACYMVVMNELKSHPEKVELLKGTP